MKGIQQLFVRCRYILRSILLNPFYEWRRFWLRVERRTGIPLRFFSPTRLYIRCMEKRLLRSLPAEKAKKVGNYFLHSEVLVTKESVVYSPGIGLDIDFDFALGQETGANIYMMDPTPRSRKFIESLALPPQYRYFPVALYTHDGEITFFSHYFVDDVQHSPSFSARNETQTSYQISVPCMRLPSLMQRNGHDSMDVLKMDIEGVADIVLKDTLDQGIKPKQVVCEFEFPAHPFKAIAYLQELGTLFDRMQKDGYEVYSITQSGLGSRIEILGVLTQ